MTRVCRIIHIDSVRRFLAREGLDRPVRQRQHHLQGGAGAAHHRQRRLLGPRLPACIQRINLHQGKLHCPQVLDGDDHVVVDGDVLAVHGQEALEADERSDLREDGEEDGIGRLLPEPGG